MKRWILSAFGVTQRIPGDGLLLTFDDGPDPHVTPAVLELLREYRAKAIFFVVGNRIPRAPEMIERILSGGHAIGNHTFLHPLEGMPRFIEYYRDVQKCQRVIESMTGQRPRLFRPPLGCITPGSLLAPWLLGLRSVCWSMDVDDWRLRHAEEAVTAGDRLARECLPGDIVLLHDDNPCVIPLLETAFPILLKRHFDLSEAFLKLHRSAKR